jgi:hypothetical protein
MHCIIATNCPNIMSKNIFFFFLIFFYSIFISRFGRLVDILNNQLILKQQMHHIYFQVIFKPLHNFFVDLLCSSKSQKIFL